MSKMVNMDGKQLFLKKLKILCSLDHPILFKFHQLILIKELQIMVFQTFYVNNIQQQQKHGRAWM